eukprot:GILI01020016.1.p1 GENE.GILI01020016.1~~GILI01020016.1.p1  ORF type:complete len:274 (+),score=52.33 GILI01020016.1:90-911(+)
MASTASPFFHTLRESFLAPPAPSAQPRSISEVNTRLMAIREKRLQGAHHSQGASATSSQRVSPERQRAVFASQPHHTLLGRGKLMRGAHHQDDDDDDPPFDVHHTDADGQHQSAAGPAPPPQFNEEDILTEEEMASLRVIELERHVRVLAELPVSTARARHNQQFDVQPSNRAPPPSHDLSVIGDDAIVKIYPKHVVLTKSNGVPLVEFVIAELCEINEHEQLHALDFCLRQKDGSKTVIQIRCPHEPTRSAIYKLVCSKRLQAQQSASQQLQ